MGPLPMWAWFSIALAIFLVIRRRTEGGWFAVGGNLGDRIRAGATVSLNGNMGTSGDEREKESSAAGTGEAGNAFSALGRDSQPSPITAGGVDGTVGSPYVGVPQPGGGIGFAPKFQVDLPGPNPTPGGGSGNY